MQCCLKQIAKELSSVKGGIFDAHSRLPKLVDWRATRNSRSIVKSEVGHDSFNKLNRLKVVAFPNRLGAAINLWQGGYVIEKIFHLCKIVPSQYSPWEKFDICFNWQDLTKNCVDAQTYIGNSFAYTKAMTPEDECVKINFECKDISKLRIGEISRSVFGYELDVDPTVHIGKAVSKSDANAAHCLFR